MGASQILGIDRLDDAVVQIQPLCQFDPGHGLQALQDQIGWNSATGNPLIAMIPVARREDGVRLDRLPEAHIVKRLKPFNHIINIVKDQHGLSVPDREVGAQIWAEDREMRP